MYNLVKFLTHLILALSFTVNTVANAKEVEEVLVSVENYPITNFDINQIIVSSPMADSYPTMDEKEQAGLRGDILIRLINLNLLYQESLALGLDRDPEYLKELKSYKKGLVFKQYMDKLRSGIEVPEKAFDEMVAKLKGNTEALDAAISQYKSQQYKLVKSLSLAKIRDQVHLQLFAERIKEGISGDTILATADNGYSLKFSELDIAEESANNFNRTEIEKSLFKKLEVDLVYIVAEAGMVNLESNLKAFEHDRLPALLMYKKEKEWIPDTTSAKKYFEDHPKIGFEPEKRFISQIVLAEQKQAKVILERIQNGESFHRMAQRFSIDPVGRKNAGQIGWVEEGTGLAEIETAIKTLKDGEVSPIIKTVLGYHLVMIEGRKLGVQRRYEEIYDQVNQAIIQTRLAPFIKTLQNKYSIEFARPVAQTYVDSAKLSNN